MFAFCNQPVGQLFVGDQQAVFERLCMTPTDTIVKECELLESAYFSAHPEMFNLLRAHAKSAIRTSKTMAFVIWDRLLQKSRLRDNLYSTYRGPAGDYKLIESTLHRHNQMISVTKTGGYQGYSHPM